MAGFADGVAAYLQATMPHHDVLEAVPGSAAEHEDATAAASPLAALQEELQAGGAGAAPSSPPCWERNQVQDRVQQQHLQQQPPPLPADACRAHQPERSVGAVLGNPDLLKAIIKCLPSMRDVRRVTRVARLWCKVADDPNLWTRLSLEDRSIPPVQVPGFRV